MLSIQGQRACFNIMFVLGEAGFIIANVTSQTICFFNNHTFNVPTDHDTLKIVNCYNANPMSANVQKLSLIL